jgi:hypothetical protein
MPQSDATSRCLKSKTIYEFTDKILSEKSGLVGGAGFM